MRRRASLFALILVVAIGCSAWAAGIPATPGPDELLAHVAALTAPGMDGRASGSEGGERAARYIVDRLKALGLVPGGDGGTFLQSFVIGSRPRVGDGAMLSRTGPSALTLDLGRDWLPHGGSLSGDLVGEIAFVGYGIAAAGSDPYARVDVRGKIALALDGGPTAHSPPPSRLDKVLAARQHGAAALLIAGDGLPALETTAVGVRLVSAAVTRRAADALLAPAGRSLAALASSDPAGGVPTGVEIHLRVALDREELRTANVVGVLPGTDPALAREAVVLGAHYDHLGREGGVVHPGADDNASGTSVVLGLARAFASSGGVPRSLIFVLFSGEEMGLLGSAHYVAHPAWPLDRTVAMLNFDMVGRMRSDRIELGGVDSGTDLRPLVVAAAAGDTLDLVLRGDPFAPSDHASFYAAGVPALFFHTGSHDDYHSPRDTVDAINAAGIAEVARLAARVTDRIARNSRPVYVKLPAPTAAGPARGASDGAFLGVSVSGQEQTEGAALGSVISGSPAARAGLRVGDVILGLDDVAVRSIGDLRRVLARRRPGDTVTLVYLREGEDRRTTATLAAWP
jgi:hypothetical protein